MISLLFNDLNSEAHYLLVKDELRTRIMIILTKKYIGRNPNKITLDPLSNRILKILYKGLWLKKLIVSKPDVLRNLIDYLQINHPALTDKNAISYKVLYYLFIDHGYDKKFFSKNDFITNINMDTCIYCNRSYTYTLTKTDKVKPEIDHFYPKSVYPFLALSYYNLIPSCETCNGFNCKKEQDPIKVGLTNPYLIKSSDFKFTYSVKSIKFLNPLVDPSSVSIIFKNKIQGHLDVFKLDKLFEMHTDHILELIIKSKLKYTEKYRGYLKNYKGFKFSDHEIDRMIIGNYTRENEIHKRPLAKLYKDLAKELGLIKTK